MGRKRTIDREALLDTAEEIVRTRGAGALTLDALAKAAGITKGGVQYAFGSKDGLTDALFDRWGTSYEAQFRAAAGDAPDPVTTVRAHITATRTSDDAASAKAAGLMAALIQTPEHLASTRAWYLARVAGLDTSTPEGRRARLAFLACEGAFMLRFFGIMDFDDSQWADIFVDIAALQAGDGQF
ncbi:TetR family transcriptional regulator [Xanthobacteraceae bacterium A53D]